MPDQQTIPPQNYMGDDQPPPAYDSIGPSPQAIRMVEARWDRVRPANWVDREAPQKPNIVFHLSSRTNIIDTLPGVSTKPSSQPFWRARMLIWCENVPRLMRMGLHWGPANIVPGFGDIKLHPPKEITSKHSRLYLVQGQRWLCYLVVTARSSQTIINFDPQWATLGACNIERADAWSWPGTKVYHYEARSKKCFNTVYADMPLDGWWPWPKGDPLGTPATDKKRPTMRERSLACTRVLRRETHKLIHKLRNVKNERAV